MMFSATGNAEQDKKLLKRGDLITVEVAALYLISAIYYERFDFAHAPFLVDRKKRWEDQRKGNTPKLIDRAWEANEKWYRKFTESGFQKLRAGDEYPLKNSQVEFW